MGYGEKQGRMMNLRLFSIAALLLLPALLLAASDGAWLRRVPDEDRARRNPVAGQAQAASAGQKTFLENCAKCHGTDAMGLRNRPGLRSERIRHAKDGEIFWMLEHGNPYLGMPPWASLSEQTRWQVIAYIRSLPPASR